MKKLAVSTVTLLALLFATPSCKQAAAGESALEKTVSGLLSSIQTSLSSVKDPATAKIAGAQISGLADKVKAAVSGIAAKAMPAATMSNVKKLIGDKVPGLVAKMEALSPEMKSVLGGALGKLKALTDN